MNCDKLGIYCATLTIQGACRLKTSYTEVHRIAAETEHQRRQEYEYLPHIAFKYGYTMRSATEKGAALQGYTGFNIPDIGLASRLNKLDKDAWDELRRYCNKLRRAPAYADPIYALLESGQYKLCSMCGEAMPADRQYFYTDDRHRDGLRSDCKHCHRSRIYETRNTKAIEKVYNRKAA